MGLVLIPYLTLPQVFRFRLLCMSLPPRYSFVPSSIAIVSRYSTLLRLPSFRPPRHQFCQVTQALPL